METILFLLLISSFASIAVTATRCARYAKLFADKLKNEYEQIWSELGRPSISLIEPFAARKLFILIDKDMSSFSDYPDLKELHEKAKFWYGAYAFSFLLLIALFLIIRISDNQ